MYMRYVNLECTYNQNDQIQTVPHIEEISHFVFLDFQKFLHGVVKDKRAKNDFASEDEVVTRQDVTQ